jgi:cytochrome c-type biogenesis protein CcmH/NrfG
VDASVNTRYKVGQILRQLNSYLMSLRDFSCFLAGVLLTVAVTMFLPTTRVVSTSSTQPAAAHTTQPTAAAGSLDEVTHKLATRLATTGGSDSEWTLLAESYDYLGRTAEAAAARAHSAAAAAPGAPLDNQTMAAIANALEK